MRLASVIIRLGLGITFVWIGVLILQNPESWGTGFLRPWAQDLLPVSIADFMRAAAGFDIIVGVWLIAGRAVWIAALLGSFHLVGVLLVSGINAITVRDVGLLSASAGLVALTMPSGARSKLSRLMRQR